MAKVQIEGEVQIKKVWQFALILLIGIIISVFFHYRNGYYYNEPYPKNTFLFFPGDVGNDFRSIFRPVSQLNPYGSPLFVYFPFTYLMVLPFTAFGEDRAIDLFIFIFIIFILKFVHSQLSFVEPGARKFLSIAMVFLSYPFLFCLDRVNVECLVFILLACFLVSFLKNRPLQSVIFLSAATAMKIYPGVFIVLLLAKKRIKETCWTVVTTATLTLVALLLIPGKIVSNINLISSNLKRFSQFYVIGNMGIDFGLSWFSLLKIVLSRCMGVSFDQIPNQEFILKCYTAFCLICFGFISFFVIFKIRTLWKQVTLLTFSMLLFPQVSYDYKLIHIYLPLVLFLDNEKIDKKSYFYTILFGLLFIPKAYGKGPMWGVFLNPLLMTLMIAVIFSEYVMNQSKSITANHVTD